MSKRVLLPFLIGALAVLAGGFQVPARGQEKGHLHGPMEKCAKACADCSRECESCARHCAELLTKGEKAHLKTLATCADCGDFCSLAARIVSRQGPTSVTTCEACAKVCDVCGSACEEFKADEHMKRCARSCRDCASACREMIKHAGPASGKAAR
jgi:hypothetical protein